jgi:FeS assembly protein IscX
MFLRSFSRRIALKWTDAEDIAEILHDKYQRLNPLTLRFTELHKKIVDLDEMQKNPGEPNEAKLEAIQMAWLDLYSEHNSDNS